MPTGSARIETAEQFRLRLIERCDALSPRYEYEAVTARKEIVRERKLARAAAERRNAELHAQKLADLGITAHTFCRLKVGCTAAQTLRDE